MAVELVCPFCGFSKKTSEQMIPDRARWAICPRCRRKFEISPSSRETDAVAVNTPVNGGPHDTGQESATGSEREGAPWESRSGDGFVRGMYHTVKSVLFSPAVFFRRLDFSGGLGEPLAFGLLIGAVGNMFAFFWPVMMISGGLFSFGGALLGQVGAGMIFLILMVAIPVCVTLSMFIYSGVLYLLLLMVRGGKNGFEATFRVVAYSQAAQVWELVPVIGSWIGGIWQLVVQVIGLREIHGVSYLRIILAFLLPVAFLFVVIIAFVIPFLMLLVQ
ncbi:MAG: YIP1 family protein [Deltaproteobacteria bacterium]|nr:YIP1 family protein [Deltaproteobacteria bacterium]